MIYAEHLQALGMAFTETNLKRHALLRSPRKQEFLPDYASVEWADAWLQQLHTANLQKAAIPSLRSLISLVGSVVQSLLVCLPAGLPGPTIVMS